MKKLVDGVYYFQENVFPPLREFYEGLAAGQSPRALFISCSDSRVSADLITQAEPGDLFVLRNAGNLIPPYAAANGGEGATIEYAVTQLGIRDIIVCGHSGCGAMQALLHPEALTPVSAVARWLGNAEATRLVVRGRESELSAEELVDAAARANVLVQIENLRSHPSVASELLRGNLQLHGWFYKFVTGEVYSYHPDRGEFVSLNDAAPVSVVPANHPVLDGPMPPRDPRGAIIAEYSQPRFKRIDCAEANLTGPSMFPFGGRKVS